MLKQYLTKCILLKFLSHFSGSFLPTHPKHTLPTPVWSVTLLLANWLPEMTTYRVKRLEDVTVFFPPFLPFKINGLRVYQWMLFVLARYRPITWHPGEILNSQWWGTGRGPALGQKIASEPIALKPSWSRTTGILAPSAYVLTLSLCFAYWTSFMSWSVKSCQVKVPRGQNSRSDQNAFSVWTQHLFSAC